MDPTFPGHYGAIVHISTMASFGLRVIRIKGLAWGPTRPSIHFALVLQRIISEVNIDVECIQMLFHAWFLDDGMLAGTKSAVLQVMLLIEELGPPLGIFINLALELLNRNELSSSFSVMIKCSQVPHFVILGGPLRDLL